MSNIENSETPSQAPARLEAEWGPDMDQQSHTQGYAGFLRVSVGLGAMVALVLIFMALFLT